MQTITIENTRPSRIVAAPRVGDAKDGEITNGKSFVFPPAKRGKNRLVTPAIIELSAEQFAACWRDRPTRKFFQNRVLVIQAQSAQLARQVQADVEDSEEDEQESIAAGENAARRPQLDVERAQTAERTAREEARRARAELDKTQGELRQLQAQFEELKQQLSGQVATSPSVEKVTTEDELGSDAAPASASDKTAKSSKSSKKK